MAWKRNIALPIRRLRMLLLAWLTLWLCCIRPGPLAAAAPLRLDVQGVEGAVRANVETALTFPPGLVRDDQVDRRWLARFVRQAPQRVVRAMQPFGYYAPHVSTQLEDADGGQVLRVVVQAGEPVRVTAVRVQVSGPGAARGALTRLTEDFPLTVGAALDQAAYEKAKQELRNRALSLGYLDADFRARQIRVDVAALSAEIDLELASGPRYYFGEVRFKGAEDYPEDFLRRFLTFAPGDVFSHAGLGRTQLRLLDSDRFRDIRLLPDRPGAVDERVPVEVVLEPSPSRRLRPGIGYGTDTGARVSLLYRDLNMFDRGHELELKANLAQDAQTAGAAYLLPDAHSLNSYTALRLSFDREDVETFLSSKLTAEVERVWDLGRGRKFSTYLQVFQEDFTVGGTSDSLHMVLPGVRFSHRHVRSLVRPRHGYRYDIELRGGHPYLGSDTGLLQLLASGNLLLDLPARWSLLIRLSTGWTLQNEPLEEIPASLRFSPGVTGVCAATLTSPSGPWTRTAT